MKTDTYHAVRVDHECNGESFWASVADAHPGVCHSLRKNGCAIVSTAVLSVLADCGAFESCDGVSPLIDYGTEGEGYLDVVSDRHSVVD